MLFHWKRQRTGLLIALLTLLLTVSGLAQPIPDPTPITAVVADTIVQIDPATREQQTIYTLDTADLRERGGFTGPSLIYLTFDGVSPDNRYVLFSHPDPAYTALPSEAFLPRWPHVIGLLDRSTGTTRIIAPANRAERVSSPPEEVVTVSEPVWSWNGDRVYYTQETFDQIMTEQGGALAQISEAVIAYDPVTDTYETLLTFDNPNVTPGNGEDQNITGLFALPDALTIQRYTGTDSGERTWWFTTLGADETITEVTSGYPSSVLGYNPVIMADGTARLLTYAVNSSDLLLIDPLKADDAGDAVPLAYYPGVYAAAAERESLRLVVFADTSGTVESLFLNSAAGQYLGGIGETVNALNNIYGVAIAPDGQQVAVPLVDGGIAVGDRPETLTGLGLRPASFVWGPVRFELTFSPG